MPRELDWDQLLTLKTVESATTLISRRWKLQVGYLDTAARRVEAFSCPLGRFEDDCDECDEVITTVLKHFAQPADSRNLLRLDHHDAFVSILAPLIVDRQCVGALGVHSCQITPLYSQEEPEILQEREVIFVRELIEEASSEIVRVLEEETSDGPIERGGTDYDSTYPNLIGIAPSMLALYQLLDKVVRSDSTVLITGENGTGKELVAKAIYSGSERKNGPFVIQNCSAFNDNLLDSELFGHVRGSFTGAVSDKQGLFEVADGGTLFLDEIGEMSPSLQVKVLRVLQEGTFIPVGGSATVSVDVRILAATNRKLEHMVEEGSFRKDLYYRINVINIQLPALRDRSEDIELLSSYFLAGHGESTKRLSPEVHAIFRGYAWPGNIRELQNEIERLVVLAGDAPVISKELLSERIGAANPDLLGSNENRQSMPEAVERLERRMIRDALVEHKGNKTRAARQLQVSRRNLIRLAQKYQL